MRSVFFPGNKVAKNLVLNPSSGTRQFFFEKSANPTTLLLYQFFEHEKRKIFFFGRFGAPSCPLGPLKSQKNFLFFFFHHFTSIPPLRNPAGWLRNHFFHLFRPLVELEKKIFFGKFSHFLIFGSKNLFYPKYGLLGLKSLGFARAFTSRNKIATFFYWEHLFPIFLALFATFWLFLCKTAFFFLPVNRTINLVIFFQIFKASP